MTQTLGQKDKYGKLLVVSAGGSMADFNFTKTESISFESIIDELTRRDYKFAVHNRVTRRTVVYKADPQEEDDRFSDAVCNQLFNDARKWSSDIGIDVLLFHASEKLAFIYQIDGLGDFDEYSLVFNERLDVVDKVSVVGIRRCDPRTACRRLERSVSCTICCFDGFGEGEVKDGKCAYELDVKSFKKFDVDDEIPDLHQAQEGFDELGLD